MKRVLLFPFALAIASFSYTPESADLEKILLECKKSYAKICDYSCRFNKREQINGKIYEEHNIVLSALKNDAIHMRWTEGDNKGTEAVFVKGRNDDKLLVRTGGIMDIFTFSLDPCGSMAMRHNRHTIMEAGLGPLLDQLEKYFYLAKNDKESSLSLAEDKPGGRTGFYLVKAVFPPGKGYYAHDIEIVIDKELMLPVKVTVLGWHGEFLEEYSYEKIKINTGLTLSDFDLKRSGNEQ